MAFHRERIHVDSEMNPPSKKVLLTIVRRDVEEHQQRMLEMNRDGCNLNWTRLGEQKSLALVVERG